MTSGPFDRNILKKRLDDHPLAVLATHGETFPYTSLVSVALTGDALAFLFPTKRNTRKYANLQGHGHVSLLLDNRERRETEVPYAITVMGVAREIPPGQERELFAGRFLSRHPHLEGFLADQDTALIRMEIVQVNLVEQFSDLFEVTWPQP